MKYLKRFEKQEFTPYNVKIIWEHGDADLKTMSTIPFKDEDMVREFLNFIWDIRKFIPNSAWENLGHFEDGHYQRQSKWIKQIDKKYGNKFSDYIPGDKYYKSNDYHPGVQGIFVEENGNPLNIIWQKAIKTNIINLPSIGDTITLNTGEINGVGAGTQYFGGKDDDWIEYQDFYEVLEEYIYDDDYHEIDAVVCDCKIELHNHKTELKLNDNNKRTEVQLYSDVVAMSYYIMCRIDEKYLCTEMHGYDPNYSKKYHRANFGTNDYFLV